MDERSDGTAQLQRWLSLLQAGDDTARAELINHACERLRRLTRKMLRCYPGLRRWEQTDDVLQNALLRLHQTLAKIKPESVQRFFGLAAVHIRRELIDLTRHHFGPEGAGAHHATDRGKQIPEGVGQPAHEPRDDTGDPAELAKWTEFHEQVANLPEEEREVVDLVFYQGIAQAEAAALLGVGERTVKRRWQAARLRLSQVLKGGELEQ